MLPKEIKKIVDLLIKNTNEDKVNWESAFDAGFNSARETDDYIVNMPDYSINVFQYVNSNDYGISILGQRGETLYHSQISVEDIEYDQMEKLFFAAKRKVAKIDEIIDDLEQALKSGKTIGKTRNNEIEDDDLPF
jgi:hypothetical protein